MNRNTLRLIADERLADAQSLLGGGRWAAAYYMSGYVIECGLKACLLRHLGESDVLFRDKKYVKGLVDSWTHDLVKLIELAGVKDDFSAACVANPTLNAHWGVVKDWKEISRYVNTRPEAEARAMFEAVSNNPDGVLEWIKTQW